MTQYDTWIHWGLVVLGVLVVLGGFGTTLADFGFTDILQHYILGALVALAGLYFALMGKK